MQKCTLEFVTQRAMCLWKDWGNRATKRKSTYIPRNTYSQTERSWTRRQTRYIHLAKCCITSFQANKKVSQLCLFATKTIRLTIREMKLVINCLSAVTRAEKYPENIQQIPDDWQPLWPFHFPFSTSAGLLSRGHSSHWEHHSLALII